MATYMKADISQKADIIDFLNYVFSYAHCPHDMKRMVPKIYADDADSLDVTHYLAMEEGRIKAIVSLLVIEVNVGGEILKYGFIGNVAVHPYSRGKGYMKDLMKLAIEDAQTLGVDIMALGGQRQRYGYFGFEHAGANYYFTVKNANIRHAMKDVACDGITFEWISDPEAPEIDIAKALYETRPVHAIRPRKDFLHIMHSWQNEFHAVKQDGRMIGYIYGNINELVLENERDLPQVIKAWFTQGRAETLDLPVQPYDLERIRYLSRICEAMSIRPVERVRVMNWEKTLRVLLAFKHQYCPLQDGATAFCIENEAFRILVEGGQVQVEKVSEQSSLPTYTINEAEILFFGLQTALHPSGEYKNWLPIPFFVDVPDIF